MNRIWRLNDDSEVLRGSFSAAVNQLRSPAGLKYKTVEDIQKSKHEFGKDFYKGLFGFHVEMIASILLVEDKLKALCGQLTPEQQIARLGFEHLRQISRTFNDCIAWTIFSPEPSFAINRLCRHRPRGYLGDQNPESVLKVISKLSRSGENLAIWNDATRCIDLHDVTAIALDSRAITFYEVKEGSVNEEILQLAHASNESEVQSGIEDLFARRGVTGIRQLERVARQEMEGKKLHTLAANDDIEDPFLKKQRIAIYPHKPLERYDAELSDLLQEVRQREFARITVDDCLHILAVNQARRRDGVSIDALIERELKSRMTWN
jgi:hypothetical protein